MNTVVLDRRDASRTARRLVAADCARAAAGRECAEAAALMTSEVVTNAVVHGGGQITFGVQVDERCCRVEVGDGEHRQPRVRRADDAAENGRGMLIIEALASSWGVSDLDTGKVVWFEVPVQP